MKTIGTVTVVESEVVESEVVVMGRKLARQAAELYLDPTFTHNSNTRHHVKLLIADGILARAGRSLVKGPNF